MRKTLGRPNSQWTGPVTKCLLQIEVQRRKGEPITEGWAQDPEGRSTTDADLAFKTGCLMPLGGSEITSGYKGYGLGLLVETLCGILGGKTDQILRNRKEEQDWHFMQHKFSPHRV